MASSNLEVWPISQEEIFYLWENFLWKDRQDPIRAMSSMKFEGGFSMSIYDIYQPSFWGLFSDQKLIGCNSCHQTSETHMRSRGLFILPEYRGQNGSQKLFEAVEESARRKECSYLWSYPKSEALPVYLKFGFKVVRPSQESPNHSYVLKPVSLR